MGPCASNRILVSLLLFLFLLPGVLEGQEQVFHSRADRRMAEEILQSHGSVQGSTVGALMRDIALEFLGTPYVAHTLEGPEERLVVNLDSVDCTTFVEYVFALARTCAGEDADVASFVRELEGIRYRDGKRKGYASRIHYFSEWISQQELSGRGADMSTKLGGILMEGNINFMSTHPQSYARLKNDPAMMDAISRMELALDKQKRFYIPTSGVPKAEAGFRDGDLVGITTGIAGLDVMHVGMLLFRDASWKLLHASSREKKVVISEKSLAEYLESSSKATGIMLLRPL